MSGITRCPHLPGFPLNDRNEKLVVHSTEPLTCARKRYSKVQDEIHLDFK